MGSEIKVSLVLVRHGESTANRDGILQGQLDFPLTEKGEGEAKILGQALNGIPWKLAFTSDLSRASQTAEIIRSQIHGKFSIPPLKAHSTLRELGFGVREGLVRHLSVSEAVQLRAKELKISVESVIDSAETRTQCHSRQMEFLIGVLIRHIEIVCDSADLECTHPVLCVTHSAFIKEFLRNFCDIDIRKINKGIPNCSCTTVSVSWKKGEARESLQCFALIDQIACTCISPGDLPWLRR